MPNDEDLDLSCCDCDACSCVADETDQGDNATALVSSGIIDAIESGEFSDGMRRVVAFLQGADARDVERYLHFGRRAKALQDEVAEFVGLPDGLSDLEQTLPTGVACGLARASDPYVILRRLTGVITH